MPEAPAPKKKRAAKKGISFRTPEGLPMPLSGSKEVNKFFRDTLAYWHGVTETESGPVVVYDPANPVGSDFLKPSAKSPVCQKCLLFESGCRSPFFDYSGPQNPIITVIYDAVTSAEDEAGELATKGGNALIRSMIEKLEPETGVSLSDVRWVPLTRCASRRGIMNPKIKGNWCRIHVVEELLFNPPQLIMPVGTAVLGLLCHKSNAQDWQGRMLTYRGWPDDWLTNPAFVQPRVHPADPSKTLTGHPLFGPPPQDYRVPMVPVQTPRIARAGNNPEVFKRWKAAFVKALKSAKEGVKANVYKRPWYRFLNDPDLIEAGLREMLDHPGLLVCYDTETKGLKPLNDSSGIV